MLDVILVIIICIILALLFIIIGSKKTRLFRRIWSTERELRAGGGKVYLSIQEKAIQELFSIYNIEKNLAIDILNENVQNLLVEAQRFDTIYRKNMGVEVAPVLAQKIMERVGNRIS